jgi:hypothetical protein
VANTATLEREPVEPELGARPDEPGGRRPRTAAEISRRRFTIAVVVGAAVVALPMLWLLWDLWNGTINTLRGVPYDNFYDMQARAMFDGRLNIPAGKMGIEAFVHDGRQYTYFGIFPSLIRMPVLLLTHRFDGELTGPSILLAWLCTGLFSSLIMWRLRILMRGQAILGRAEAASYGALMATILGGSVIVFLSATPFVYNEDFAWSVPLTVGSLFALLGVLERPSWGRVTASGVLVLCTSLNRTPTGYACIIAAGLVTLWFALGRGGQDRRRWALPLAAVAVVPFAATCAVTYAKFGIPIGLPMADQVWATVNAHRRYFLAANGGKAFSFAFLPSTAWAYLQPFGLHLTTLFPFVTPPTAPAAPLAGAVLDQTYPTASIPATMPLLLLLSCWGAVTAFRRKAVGQVRLTRIIVLAAAAATAGVFLWGYISERYMADFMPLLIIAGTIGLIDIWRRLDHRSRTARRRVLGVVVLMTVYGIVANLAISVWPVAQWSMTQDVRFVSAQRTLSLGYLASSVRTGPVLPYWAPSGQLFAVNHCSGLYLSTGNRMNDVPGQQIEHYTWLPVEQSPSFTQTIGFTFNQTWQHFTQPVTLMTYGAARLVVKPDGPQFARLYIENSGTTINWPPARGFRFPDTLIHERYEITVTTDPNLKSITVIWYGEKMLNHYLDGTGPAVVAVTPTSTPAPVVSVSQQANPGTPPSSGLCRSLVGKR